MENSFITRPALQRLIRLNSAIIAEFENNPSEVYDVHTLLPVEKKKLRKAIGKMAEVQKIMKSAMAYFIAEGEDVVGFPLFSDRELDKLRCHTRELIKCYSAFYSEYYKGRHKIRTDKRKTMAGLEAIQRSFRQERVALGHLESKMYAAYNK